MSGFIKLLALSIALAGTSLIPLDSLSDGFANKEEARVDYRRGCLAITTNNSTYMRAVDKVTSMPMVKDWVASLTAERRMAIGKHLDKTELVEGHCYWSISIYESDSSQLHLWKIFRVDIKTYNIFVMNDDGDFRSVDIK